MKNIFLKNGRSLNFVSLAAIQGANALIPVVLFPYLLFTLGTSLFARLVVLEAIAIYVLTISLYSFEIISVQRLIEAKKRNQAEITRIYFETLYARIFLFLVSLVIVLMVFSVFFPNDLFYAAIWMLLPLGQILQSNYYYQAIEKNGVNAVVIIFSRLTFLAAGYFLIKGPDDIIIAHALLPLSYFVSGGISVFLVIRKINTKILAVDFFAIWKLLCDGWVLFLGNLAIILYRNSNVLILTMISGNAVVISTYAMAEKFVKMLQAICTPLNQLFFPRVMSALQLRKLSPMESIWRYTKPQILIFSVFLMGVNFLAYLDASYRQMIFNENILNIFFIMSFAPIFGIANFMFGMVGLSAMKKSASFARGTVLTGFSSVVLCAIGGQFFSAYGAAFAFLTAEIILFAYVMFAINKA